MSLAVQKGADMTRFIGSAIAGDRHELELRYASLAELKRSIDQIKSTFVSEVAISDQSLLISPKLSLNCA